MDLKNIKIKTTFKGRSSTCYVLENGDILKIFNNPKRKEEIKKFKYFLEYSNNSFMFPKELVYDSKYFYGYVTGFINANTLEDSFYKSSLVKLSSHSLKLERDIDLISQAGILVNDLHSKNILYDGAKLSVIDFDDYDINKDINKTNISNQRDYKGVISNLFLDYTQLKFDKKQYLLEKLNKYNYMTIRPSEIIIIMKELLEKYCGEEIDKVEDFNNIVRR